jgi:OmpA-OmpF porin, OOP family
MNKLYSISLFLGLAAVAGSASAADTGWYAGVDLGSSNYAVMSDTVTQVSQELSQGGFPNTTKESDTATAYGVDVGYQFLRYFAVEGGYTDFGSSTGDINVQNPVGNAHVDIHAKGETLFAVGILPLSDRFSLFGKFGLLAYNQDATGSVTVAGVGSQTIPKASDNGTTTGIGVGASFAFNDRFGLRLGFNRFHAVGDQKNTGEGTIDLGYLQFVVHF